VTDVAPGAAAAAQRPGLVGRRVPRTNDRRLLAGRGHYTDDIAPAGVVHAAVLRSPVPAGRLVALDASAALALDGVHLVIGALADAAALGRLPCVWTQPGQRIVDYEVLSAHITHVGQELALVVADSRELAEDAIGLLDVEIRDADDVVDDPVAAAAGAPFVYPEMGTNVVVEFDAGDPRAEVERALANAHHVVTMDLAIPRVIGRPIETRGIVAAWDRVTEDLTVWVSTQAVHHVREHLCALLGLRTEQVRVIAPDVGGGFGTKEHLYPDEVLVCEAARRLGRPVKWIEDRFESFTATLHARAQYHHARLGLDADGNFVALWTDLVHDQGAHPSNVGPGPSIVATGMLPGPYRFGTAGAHARCVVTNRTPTGAYRGFGMQQAAWVRERLIDEAARQLGIDPVELRLRNMIGPREMPYTTSFHHRYDSGDYPRSLTMVADAASSFEPSDPHDGMCRGLGYASFVEFTGLGPAVVQQAVGFHLNGFESSIVRIENDGSVTVLTGAASLGQGIETTLAQIAADGLGVSIEHVRVVIGDTGRVPYSSAGAIASRSLAVAGGALVQSCRRLAEKVAAIAAHRLEADRDDIELVDGRVQVRGTPTRGFALAELADTAWMGWDLPDGCDAGLEERVTYDPDDITYAYASHAAAVAVDPDTGQVTVERYWVVHDAGVIVNPMIADGQVQGGFAQGLGMALFEEVRYVDGQPAQSSFMDYLVPTASCVPDVVLDHLESPSPVTPGGMKGLGEGGLIPVPAAIANAVANAVPEIADRLVTTPLAADVIWTLMQEAGVDA
jgi:aerobic carbon-monoxide dehydrogenase large subunit